MADTKVQIRTAACAHAVAVAVNDGLMAKRRKNLGSGLGAGSAGVLDIAALRAGRLLALRRNPLVQRQLLAVAGNGLVVALGGGERHITLATAAIAECQRC